MNILLVIVCSIQINLLMNRKLKQITVKADAVRLMLLCF